MTDFLFVLAIAGLAAVLTYLGVPAAERFDVPQRVVSASLQFAAGLITALVALSLMPPAVRYGPPVGVVLGFFVGGALYVMLEYYSARRIASRESQGGGQASIGFYAGILVDLVIDGMVIGVGSTLTLETGLLLAVGLAVGTAPLAFVTIATAKRQGMSPARRRRLSRLLVVCLLAGAMVGFLVMRHQPLGPKMVVIALAAGFLFTTVTQSMIPEANREGEPSFAGILFLAGLALYALTSLTV